MDARRATRGRPRPPRSLPTLTPAPSSSISSASAPHKAAPLQPRPSRPRRRSDATGRAVHAPHTSSSFAYIFFNRRPLDVLRRTTLSSLLTRDTHVSPLTVVPTRCAGHERFVCNSRGQHADQTAHWRRPTLPRKPPSETSKGPPANACGSAHTERRKRPERAVRGPTEMRKRPTPCPPTGAQFLMDVERAAALTTLERVEIHEYDEIYFVSSLAIKRTRCQGDIHTRLPVRGDERAMHVEPTELPSSSRLFNHGYDTELGEYVVVLGNHVAYRYEVLHALGQGSFGQVVRCLDHSTRHHVAVKMIRNRPKSRDQARSEIELLAQLARGAAAWDATPPIVHMHDHFEFRSHLCIVFEVLGTNLYEHLVRRHFRGLAMENVRTVGTELAHALLFLKQHHVIHCDLKPENVLLRTCSALAETAVAHVTLIDFGSSCLEGERTSTYIQSRFYRSPEVLLGYPYTSAIDMWSFACLLVELHTGHPIFPGECEQDQVACIMELLDVPPVHLLDRSTQRAKFFEEVVADPVDDDAGPTYVPKSREPCSRGRPRVPGSRSLASAVRTDDADFLALLHKCFVWDPRCRLTPEQALDEPWLRRQALSHSRNLKERRVV
ncbi:hypothetical protein PsorP6_013154 [Peronosclerospora sorghi]|uniref:Uncharacterized protein n=1 Tax=Peronosclerospora sorghi TaxID=230839 RepID=A0ACC0WHK8_9STRA|nr:hypothetical protein PsorP6_013154 [Peronosclerospora sorghi]